MMKGKLTDLCGNRVLHNNFINAFCEISTVVRHLPSTDYIMKDGKQVAVVLDLTGCHQTHSPPGI